MDGYVIGMDPRRNFTQISQHASTHGHLVRLLEECVPAGSELLGIVLSSGSQIQSRKPLLPA